MNGTRTDRLAIAARLRRNALGGRVCRAGSPPRRSGLFRRAPPDGKSMAQADALTDAQGRDDTRKAILAVWAGTHADEARAYVEAVTNPARRSDSARLLGPSL